MIIYTAKPGFFPCISFLVCYVPWACVMLGEGCAFGRNSLVIPTSYVLAHVMK